MKILKGMMVVNLKAVQTFAEMASVVGECMQVRVVDMVLLVLE